MHNLCEELIKKYKINWQYPVITEKIVFEQEKNNDNYIGLPWATIIDKINYIKNYVLKNKKYRKQKKKFNDILIQNENIINNLLEDLQKKLDKNKNYITCCQHINFEKFYKYFSFLGIKTIYCSHKIKNKNYLNEISIKPLPLYAVNFEDKSRNNIFNNVNFIDFKRKYLYSFLGNVTRYYLTKIRNNILKMNHPTNCLVKNTNEWHFNKIVYQEQILEKNVNNKDTIKQNNKTEKYNKILLESRFSLCPSGSGPNSIRFWESLAVGSIPILLADTLDLPKHKLWDKAILRIQEKRYKEIPNILSTISNEKENEMRMNCLKIYNDFRNNFIR